MRKWRSTFWFISAFKWNNDWVVFFTPLVDWLIKSSTPTAGLITNPAAPLIVPYFIISIELLYSYYTHNTFLLNISNRLHNHTFHSTPNGLTNCSWSWLNAYVITCTSWIPLRNRLSAERLIRIARFALNWLSRRRRERLAATPRVSYWSYTNLTSTFELTWATPSTVLPIAVPTTDFSLLERSMKSWTPPGLSVPEE